MKQRHRSAFRECLFGKLMPVTGIEELVVWTPPKELDTTGEKVDVVEHLRFLMGELVNAYLPANGLDIGEITDKGKALITVMPEEIQSPEMTADWETKLLQIERSEMEPETFMTEIKEMISSLVTTTEAAKGANALMKNKIIGVCPNCGANVVEREKGWFCENRECRFVLWKDNAFFKRLGKRLDAHVADKLLRDGRVRLKDCKSAKGKTYNATVLLSTEPDGRSKFSLEFEGGC